MSEVRKVDGTFDFAGGVNGSRVPTVQSQANPNGLKRNQLSWMANGTTRGGGITQRTGWQPVLAQLISTFGWYQGGIMYEPKDGTDPYLLVSIGGILFQVLLTAPFTVRNLSAAYPATGSNPANEQFFHFAQGGMFVVIQVGDGVTNALFWDGEPVGGFGLRRSLGLGGGELPPATCMVFYGLRLWYAQGTSYCAGDIMGGPSGTIGPPYFKTDSILKVTENPLAIGGDNFPIPSEAGDIRALFYPANLDASLGQGPLLIGTRKQIFALTVPVNRNDWINADSKNMPQQTVIQVRWGPVGDRCIPHVNGDLFYRTMEPGIRSLSFALRYFQQWANTPISQNENRILNFDDRALLRFSSGIEFDNRLWETAAPILTPSGVVHRAILPLDFDPLGSLEEKIPPVWEGHYEGLPIYQLFEGDFGGRQRAFAVVQSKDGAFFEIWEFTRDQRRDNIQPTGDQDQRVNWFVEFPAFTWSGSIGEFELKELDGGEIWFDKISGTVDLKVSYRPDADPCWHLWFATSFCAAATTCEDLVNPVCYPVAGAYREGYKFPVGLPKPPATCNDMMHRPINIGYQHQVKVELTGWCRIRGLLLYALPRKQLAFETVPCPQFNAGFPG